MIEILAALEKNIIVCGHFGSGKTNVAVALALALAAAGDRSVAGVSTAAEGPTAAGGSNAAYGSFPASPGRVALVDLDIVNPYFRAADALPLLRGAGIDCIIPRFANTNVDLPGIGGEVLSVFSREEIDPAYRAVFDVGGDNGAIALGRYTEYLNRRGCSMLYVLNIYRPLTADPGGILADIAEIEEYSRLRAGFIINNSNLGRETTPGTIELSLPLADEISRLTGLPLLGTTLQGEETRQKLTAGHPHHKFINIPDSTRRLF